MGTRGFYGFRYKGRYILFYNHWDSYCDGLGNQILSELKGFTEAEYRTIRTLIKNYLRDGTFKEGMEDTEGKDFESLMKAVSTPTEYALVHVGRDLSPPDMATEYVYILDLDKNFLRVVAHEDLFKFSLYELPTSMGMYDEECESDIVTNLSDTDEDE
jgi:hypothetical protein